MPKKLDLSAAERAQLALRLLSREEPAARNRQERVRHQAIPRYELARPEVAPLIIHAGACHRTSRR